MVMGIPLPIFPGNNPAWYVDSGATSHVTSELDNLSIRSYYKGKGKLYVEDGSPLTISNIGSSYISSNSHPLALCNILHVPKITKSLISVSQFTKDNNVIAKFFSDGCLIKDKVTKQVFLEGSLKGGLYQLDVNQIKRPSSIQASQVHLADVQDLSLSVNAGCDKTVHSLETQSSISGPCIQTIQSLDCFHTSCNKEDHVATVCNSCFLASATKTDCMTDNDKIVMIWHNRLGHPSSCVLDKVLHIVDDHITSRSINFCDSCPLGKSHRLFSGVSDFKAKTPLELVYSDVWGPALMVSCEGYRYYIHFLDDYSRFTWIYPLQAKSEAKISFVHFLSMVESQFNKKLVCLIGVESIGALLVS